MNEFEAETENSGLKQKIIARIREDGAISFRDYMEMALYEPGLGYYTSDHVVLGREGDYLTSPEVSPIFGAMIGRQFREMWEKMGQPAEFALVEAGAGSGVLARDILTWSRRITPAFFDAIRYTIVEVSAPLRGRQRHRIEAEGFSETVRWLDELPGDVEGVIFSNELLDAFPVHLIANDSGALKEIYVTWRGEEFAEDLREPSHQAAAHLKWAGAVIPEGCRAEVNPKSIEWTRAAATSLRRGFIITIDYGYEIDGLYAPWRTDGTLLCFYKHNPGRDPYRRVGRQDMTSHIDLTSVRRAGEEAGLTTLGLVSQMEFLTNLGITEALQAAEGSDLEEYFARRRAITELLDPGGLGRISVLVQSRAVGDIRLTGLRSA
jgi:SAM-dependent MidA family methyltransferase